MAVSGTRRGPGWWMDRDGGWNPPELWPESTPPLPGWVRNDKARWEAPPEVDDADTLPVIDLTKPAPISNTSVRTPRHAAVEPAHAKLPEDTSDDEESEDEKPVLNLRYAEPPSTAKPAHAAEEPAGKRRWLIPTVIAVVIALLLVVLLVL